jgi:serine/threonine protein kinase
MKTLVGTPYYVAPEVLDGDYGKECDCWSLGVIMYAVLSGCLPFYGQSPKEVFDKILQSKVSFNTKEFRGISESAKDLITKLLTKDKNLRYSCA